MSNNEQFDDFFKKELQNFSPEVPAGAWEKLLKAKERKRPVIAWWRNSKYLFLLACIVGASILLPLVFLNSSSKVNTNKLVGNEATTTSNLPNNSNESSQTASNAITVDNKPNENNHNASNAIVVDKKSNENTHLSPTTKNYHQPNIDVHTTLPTNKTMSVTYASKNETAQKLTDKTNFLKLTPTSSKRGIGKTFIDNNIKKNSNQRVAGASKNKLTNASTNKPIVLTSIDHLSNKVLNTSLQTKKNKKGIEIEVDQDIVGNSATTIINDGGNWLTNKVPIEVDKIYYSQSNENARIIINKAAIKSPDCPANEKNAVGKIRYFTFYAGPDLVSKKYIDTSNSTLLNKRKESTAIISAFSAGINYTNVFANGVSFSAGINYSQINEKFNFIQGNVVQNTYVIDPNTGDTTSRSTVVGTRYKTTINRYRTIDVPLTIGYEMGNTNLHVNAYAGAVVNVYSWQKGDMLGVDLQPVSITTGKASDMYRYKTNIGVGLIGGASIFYKLNDRLHLMAQPYCRYNFAPLNNTTLSLQEKFFTIGVRLGIRVDL